MSRNSTLFGQLAATGHYVHRSIMCNMLGIEMLLTAGQLPGSEHDQLSQKREREWFCI